MKIFAEGFDYQKGAIFGFGPSASKDTEIVLKICDTSEAMLNKLDENVQVHNILEEINVGCVNHGIQIRGKECLNTISRKMILNSSFDLVEKMDPSKFKKFRHHASEIKYLKTQWNEKMKALQEKGYTEKDLLNSKKEAQRLTDLEFLKTQEIPGPFTSQDEVLKLMSTEGIDDNAKNSRMYREVRYARMTSLTLKENASVFRLKKAGKNLETQMYAENLMQYLDDSRNIGTVTIADLNCVQSKLEERDSGVEESNNANSNAGTLEKDDKDNQIKNDESTTNESVDTSMKIGEHLAVFWIEDGNSFVWYLYMCG